MSAYINIWTVSSCLVPTITIHTQVTRIHYLPLRYQSSGTIESTTSFQARSTHSSNTPSEHLRTPQHQSAMSSYASQTKGAYAPKLSTSSSMMLRASYFVPDDESNREQPQRLATTHSLPTLRAAMVASRPRSLCTTEEVRPKTLLPRPQPEILVTGRRLRLFSPVMAQTLMAGRDGYN